MAETSKSKRVPPKRFFGLVPTSSITLILNLKHYKLRMKCKHQLLTQYIGFPLSPPSLFFTFAHI